MNIQKKLIKKYIVLQLLIYLIFSISIILSDFDIHFTYILFIFVTGIIILNSIIVIHQYIELNKFDNMLLIKHYCALRKSESLKQSQANLHIKRNDIYSFELAYLFLKYSIPIPRKKVYLKMQLNFLNKKHYKWIYLLLCILFFTSIIYMVVFSDLFYDNLNISLIMLGIYLCSILVSFSIGFKLNNFMKRNKKLLQNELLNNKQYILWLDKEFLKIYQYIYFHNVPLNKLESHLKNNIIKENLINIPIVNDDILCAKESILVHPVKYNSKLNSDLSKRMCKKYKQIKTNYLTYCKNTEQTKNIDVQFIPDSNKIIANIFCIDTIDHSLYKKEQINTDTLLKSLSKTKQYADENHLSIGIPYEIAISLFNQKEFDTLKQIEKLFNETKVSCVYYN